MHSRWGGPFGIGSHKTAWTLLDRLRAAMSALDLPQLIGTVEPDETAVGGYQPGRRGFAGANKTTVLADDPSPGPATQRPCRAIRPSRRSGSAGRSGRLPRGTAAPIGQNVSGPLDAGSPARPTSGQPLRTTPFRPFFGLRGAESGRSSVRKGVWSGRRDSNPRHSAWEVAASERCDRSVAAGRESVQLECRSQRPWPLEWWEMSVPS